MSVIVRTPEGDAVTHPGVGYAVSDGMLDIFGAPEREGFGGPRIASYNCGAWSSVQTVAD